MALVQQYGLRQCLYHYPEDTGVDILLGRRHLLPPVPGQSDAGDTPRPGKRRKCLALGYSAPSTEDAKI